MTTHRKQKDNKSSTANIASSVGTVRETDKKVASVGSKSYTATSVKKVATRAKTSTPTKKSPTTNQVIFVGLFFSIIWLC